MNKTDIILVTCNRINFLKQCIDALEERLSTPYRLIVINNNSKDGTDEYLAELKSKSDYYIKIIRNEQPPQLSGCYTQGLEHVESEHFVCLQDDIIIPHLEPDVLSRLIKLIDENEHYSGIGLRKPLMKGNFTGELTRTKTVGAGFRIHRTQEWRDAGGFGNRRWETLATRDQSARMGKVLGVATNIWLKDLGHCKFRGYPEWYRKEVGDRSGWEWIRKQPNRLDLDPYKNIDEKTHEPRKTNIN